MFLVVTLLGPVDLTMTALLSLVEAMIPGGNPPEGSLRLLAFGGMVQAR